MKLVLAATGASGAIYLQRLLDLLDPKDHEIHLVFSTYSRQVINEELGGELLVASGIHQHNDKTMNVPFVSGSAQFDAMVVVPCSMGTLGRIAAGTSETTILRAADVFLKERRKLILVPRETPLSAVHLENMLRLTRAGAIVMPAAPGFYHRPKSIDDLVNFVVARVLDHLGVRHSLVARWNSGTDE